MSEERLLLEWEWQDRADERERSHRHLMDTGVFRGPSYWRPRRYEWTAARIEAERVALEEWQHQKDLDDALCLGALARDAARHLDDGKARMWATDAAHRAHAAGVGTEDGDE